jgi:hypothetical protein
LNVSHLVGLLTHPSELVVLLILPLRLLEEQNINPRYPPTLHASYSYKVVSQHTNFFHDFPALESRYSGTADETRASTSMECRQMQDKLAVDKSLTAAQAAEKAGCGSRFPGP